MEPERWRAIERLFHAALDRPALERAEFVARACGADEPLHTEVVRLLAIDATDDDLVARYGALPDPEVPRADPLIGRLVGAYRLVARIAAGGMGVVYRAVRADGLFDQEVAVKLVRGEVPSEEALRRFDLERRTLAFLNHPHIARLFDGGTTSEGTPYLVMEFVDGRPIDRWCGEGRLRVAERLALFAVACRAVHFAHQNLVVHGDLKPPNILVDARGAVKLLDFGIARLLGDDSKAPAERTLTLARLMTPEYASPEQWRGEPLATTADVYSLGVVLHVLLTGRKPFRVAGLSAGEWERTLTEREATRPSARILPARVRERGPDEDGEVSLEEFAASCRATPASLARALRGDLDRIVLMALRKDPARRYASALALGEDVERHLQGRPVLAREDSLGYRTWSFVRRNRLAVTALAALLMAPSVGLFVSLRAERRARRDADHARIEAESFRRIAELNLESLLAAGAGDGAEHRETLRATVLAQADQMRQRYAAERHLQANLLDALGLFCLRTGVGDEDAAALLQEALLLRESEFGAQSLEVALSLRSTAELAERRGDLVRAAELRTRALALHRSSDEVHTDVALAATELGAVLRQIGRLDEAEVLYAEALDLRRAQPGSHALPVADSLEALSGVLLARGKVGTALPLVEEALAIRRGVLGDLDAETLRTSALLAEVQRQSSP